MTTNTALRPSARIDHTHCVHPRTKAGRASCRKGGREALATIDTTPAPALSVPLTCSCNIPLLQPVCPICDCPADLMTALGLLLTAE